MLDKVLMLYKDNIERHLKIGYATWDAIIERVERQGRSKYGDYYDEQVWTFLVCAGYAIYGADGVKILYNRLCGKWPAKDSDGKIWFEVLPDSPRKNEGKTHLDLALGSLVEIPGTSSGVGFDPEAGESEICFCECKWYSDIACDVTYDRHRNQLARVIENALTFQSNGVFPDKVHVTLITPAVFMGAKQKSRLYQYKFDEYKDKAAIVRDIRNSGLQIRSTGRFKYPDIAKRVECLTLHWVSFEDLFKSIPTSAIANRITKFQEKYNGTTILTNGQGKGKA